MKLLKLMMVTCSSLVLASACSAKAPESAPDKSVPEQVAVADKSAESERLYQWLEQAFEEEVALSPIYLTTLGRKTDYDKWGQATDARAEEIMAWRRENQAAMEGEFEYDDLDANGQLNYRLYSYQTEQEVRSHEWREKAYVFTQRGGAHQSAPTLLMNFHNVESEADARAYITRLSTLDTYLDQHRQEFEERAAQGVLPPGWAFPQMILTATNVISGAPFEDGAPSAVYADIKKKINSLELDADAKIAMVVEAERALLQDVKPAYERLIRSFESLQKSATTDDGVWKLPDGAAYYNHRISASTTTELSAEEIHQIGQEQLERIHLEMMEIAKSVGFEGNLQEFFEFLRTDEQFFYPNTDEGRQQYLNRATEVIDDMKSRLDTLFITKPKSDLVVKRVEAFREKGAGIAFYNRPAEDGSRPGVYYVNLYDMKTMPIYQLEAIAYHEGAPGHHMQIAISQELEGVPRFRRFGGYGAYIEGWGLYSEELPKEIGLYQDPYQDFGRLGLEAWRAVRLVVDTGLHYKKWTREEAIDFMINNAPLSEEQARKEIERYIVTPGQATSYMIGKLKIKELRAKATQELGDNFDLREFHDVILANGAVPLAVLEELVDDWITERQSRE